MNVDCVRTPTFLTANNLTDSYVEVSIRLGLAGIVQGPMGLHPCNTGTPTGSECKVTGTDGLG